MASDPSASAAATRLRVLFWNIEYGGREGFDAVVDVLRAAGADVVALAEAMDRAPALAARAGYGHVDARAQLLSRFPLHAAAPGVSLVELPGPRFVALVNAHLDDVEDGACALRDGAPLERVYAQVISAREHACACACSPVTFEGTERELGVQ